MVEISWAQNKCTLCVIKVYGWVFSLAQPPNLCCFIIWLKEKNLGTMIHTENSAKSITIVCLLWYIKWEVYTLEAAGEIPKAQCALRNSRPFPNSIVQSFTANKHMCASTNIYCFLHKVWITTELTYCLQVFALKRPSLICTQPIQLWFSQKSSQNTTTTSIDPISPLLILHTVQSGLQGVFSLSPSAPLLHSICSTISIAGSWDLQLLLLEATLIFIFPLNG